MRVHTAVDSKKSFVTDGHGITHIADLSIGELGDKVYIFVTDETGKTPAVGIDVDKKSFDDLIQKYQENNHA